MSAWTVDGRRWRAYWSDDGPEDKRIFENADPGDDDEREDSVFADFEKVDRARIRRAPNYSASKGTHSISMPSEERLLRAIEGYEREQEQQRR